MQKLDLRIAPKGDFERVVARGNSCVQKASSMRMRSSAADTAYLVGGVVEETKTVIFVHRSYFMEKSIAGLHRLRIPLAHLGAEFGKRHRTEKQYRLAAHHITIHRVAQPSTDLSLFMPQRTHVYLTERPYRRAVFG